MTRPGLTTEVSPGLDRIRKSRNSRIRRRPGGDHCRSAADAEASPASVGLFDAYNDDAPKRI